MSGLKKKHFLKNVTIVMTGTALAQLISVAISPLLTRIYGADSFGLMGIFVASVTVISTVAALRYDLALVLPKDIEDSRALFLLGSSICFCICLMLFILQPVNKPVMQFLGLGEISELYFLLPTGVFFFTLSSLCDSWLSRNKQFKVLSITTIIGTLSSSAVMLLGWGVGASIVTLLLGSIFNNITKVFYVLYLNKNIFWVKREKRKEVICKIKSNAKKYRDFVIYRTPQDLINALSQNIPSLLLGYIFAPKIVGFFWLANRVLRLPSTLISEAVRKVLYQKLSEMHNGNNPIIAPAIKATLGLIIIGIIPVIVIFLFGPQLFSYVFGSEWSIAGEYSRWISIWVFSLFINVPAIVIIPIIEKQKFLLNYMLIMLPIRLGPIWYIGSQTNNASLTIATFCIVNALSNFLLIGYVFFQAKNLEKKTDSKGL
jgi:O-antigen/teichoic acid export membrane protein